MDPAIAPLVERYALAHFPLAHSVIVAGSTAAGTRTATSDLDVLVVGPAGMFPSGRSLARTDAFEGEVVEVFAYTADAFRAWAERGFDEYRPVIANMLVDGVPVRFGAEGDALRAWARSRLARGPQVDAHRLDLLRYTVTDLADDLAGCRDPFEEAVVRAALVEALARFLLLAHGRWVGSGKWLVRRLREWDGPVAQQLAAAALDSAAALALVDRLLAPYGGRLQTGFTR